MKPFFSILIVFIVASAAVLAVPRTTKVNTESQAPQGPCRCLTKVSKRIVNGVEIEPDKYPWQVSIHETGVRYAVGAGAILNEDTILTAASVLPHPEDRNAIKQFKIRLPGQKKLRSIERIVTNSLYERAPFEAKNDIALIRLKKKLNFKSSKNIEPACLNTSITHAYPGELTFAGYGSVNPVKVNTTNGIVTNFTVSPVLKEGSASDMTFTTQACKGEEERMICATNEKRKDVFCLFDSGAPLHHNIGKHTYVVGVLGLPLPEYNKGEQTATLCTKTNNAARLSYYSSWLVHVMKHNNFSDSKFLMCTHPN